MPAFILDELSVLGTTTLPFTTPVATTVAHQRDAGNRLCLSRIPKPCKGSLPFDHVSPEIRVRSKTLPVVVSRLHFIPSVILLRIAPTEL